LPSAGCVMARSQSPQNGAHLLDTPCKIESLVSHSKQTIGVRAIRHIFTGSHPASRHLPLVTRHRISTRQPCRVETPITHRRIIDFHFSTRQKSNDPARIVVPSERSESRGGAFPIERLQPCQQSGARTGVLTPEGHTTLCGSELQLRHKEIGRLSFLCAESPAACTRVRPTQTCLSNRQSCRLEFLASAAKSANSIFLIDNSPTIRRGSLSRASSPGRTSRGAIFPESCESARSARASHNVSGLPGAAASALGQYFPGGII
jgi:hypothetical protein